MKIIYCDGTILICEQINFENTEDGLMIVADEVFYISINDIREIVSYPY